MMSHSGYSMGNQFGNPNDGVDPSDLTMQQGGFMPYSYGSQQNMGSSFNFGNSGIDTDELLDLEISGQNGVPRDNNINYMQDQSAGGIAMSHQSQMSHLYSNTPDGAPMASPFVNNSFNYEQFRMNQQNPHLQSGSFDQNYLSNKSRPGLSGMDRTSSDTRSPMTPKTPPWAL